MEKSSDNEVEDKKMLLEKFLKLIPQDEISDLMVKFKNEVSQVETSSPLNENEKESEEEKNQSDNLVEIGMGAEKLSTNIQENPTYDIESQEKKDDKKEKEIEKANLISKYPEPKEFINLSEEDFTNYEKEKEKEQINYDNVNDDNSEGGKVDNILEEFRKILPEGGQKERPKYKPREIEKSINIETEKTKDAGIFNIEKEKKNLFKSKIDNNALLGKKRKGGIQIAANAAKQQRMNNMEVIREVGNYKNNSINNINNYNYTVEDNEITSRTLNTTLDRQDRNDYKSKYRKENIIPTLMNTQIGTGMKIGIGQRNNIVELNSFEENEQKFVKAKNYMKEEELNSEQKSISEHVKNADGFINVLQSLIKPTLNRNNTIEKQLDDMTNDMGLLKTSLYVFKEFFKNFIKNQKIDTNSKESNIMETQRKNIPNIPSISRMNNQIQNSIINIESEKEDDEANNNKDEIKSIISEDNELNQSRRMYKSITENKLSLKKNKKEEIRLNDYDNDNDNYINYGNYAKNNIIELKEREREREREKLVEKEKPREINFNEKGYTLSIHYHKDNRGRIYKFAKHHLIAKDIFVFYCCDRDCHATANYFIKSKKFQPITEHDKRYEDHLYIRRVERDQKIMEEFKKKTYHEAQVFKKQDGPKVIQWYD